MSLFRSIDSMRSAYGESVKRVKSILSRRQISEYLSLERVNLLGRQARDGSFEETTADNFQPVGLVARPSENATVESVCAQIGGDGDHPVQVAVLDWGRQAVIDVEKLGTDETIVYNSSAVIKFKADGTIEIGSVGGTRSQLATLADLQEVIDVFLTHIHNAAGAPTGGPQDASQVPITSIDVDGTQVLKAE